MMQSFKNEVTQFEKKSDTIVFTFGRMNPPTRGHERLINFIKYYAAENNCDYRIYTSQTYDSEKNPLSYSQKIKYIRKSVSDNVNLVYDESVKTIFDCLKQIKSLGYKNVIFAVGRDQIEHFSKMFKKYIIGVADYDFQSIHVLSTGSRTDGVSGTDARNAAKDNDFETFRTIVSDTLSVSDQYNLFTLVKNNL